jgi:RimJ/RimL family protein N-acetyltransferase
MHAAGIVSSFFADPRVSSAYFIREVKRHPSSLFMSSVADWHTSQFISLCAESSEHGIVGWIHISETSLGYVVNPRFWGMGYGLEMVRAFCDHYPAQLGLSSVNAVVLRENVASRRIVERAGFRFEGLEQRAYRGRSGVLSVLHYEKSLNLSQVAQAC